MVGEFLVLDQLILDICFVLGNRQVVVLVDSFVGVSLGASKNARSQYPFSADTVTEVDVNGQVAFRGGHIAQVVEGKKCAVPVVVSGSVFVSKPLDKIPIVKI